MPARNPRRAKKFFLIFWKAIVKLSVVIRALMVRALFVIFVFLAVWNVVIVKLNDMYWLLLGCAIPFGAEVLYACKVIFIEKKDSSKIGKWFSPVVLLFLCSACPTIWIIEISIWSQRQPATNVTPVARNINASSRNVSSANVVIIKFEFTLKVENHLQRRATQSPKRTTQLGSLLVSIVDRTSRTRRGRVRKKALQEDQPRINNIEEVKEKEILIEVEKEWRKVSPDNRVRMIEQFLLLCLIFARWLLPRAGITRQQLSQLLLVNIGMGADILELFEAFKEPVVRQDFLLTIAILSLWQASLLQFCLTKTATKARKIRGGFSQTLKASSDSWTKLPGCLFCETELWAISTSVLLQDGPFLVLRIVLIIQYNVASYSNLFFTCKNTLVILLQIFRVGVIIFEHRSSDFTRDEELGYIRQNRSVTIFGEQSSHELHRPGSSLSSTINSTKSAHTIFQKKSADSNFFLLQIERCSSQNQMCPPPLNKASSSNI